jgi:hypothetical protein
MVAGPVLGVVYERVIVVAPSLHWTKTYWQPAPQLTGDEAASVCSDPAVQEKTCGVSYVTPSTVRKPDPSAG